MSPSSGWRRRSRRSARRLVHKLSLDKTTRVFLTSAVVHNSTSWLSHQEDRVHLSASSSVGSEWVSPSLNFFLLFASKKKTLTKRTIFILPLTLYVDFFHPARLVFFRFPFFPQLTTVHALSLLPLFVSVYPIYYAKLIILKCLKVFSFLLFFSSFSYNVDLEYSIATRSVDLPT